MSPFFTVFLKGERPLLDILIAASLNRKDKHDFQKEKKEMTLEPNLALKPFILTGHQSGWWIEEAESQNN